MPKLDLDRPSLNLIRLHIDDLMRADECYLFFDFSIYNGAVKAAERKDYLIGKGRHGGMLSEVD